MKAIPHVVIVGGTAGVGRVLASRFSAQSARVTVLGRRARPEFDSTASSVHHRVIDLSDIESTKETMGYSISEYGSLSHLIFCQRYRGSEDVWEGELKVSLNATKRLVDFCADKFVDDGWPSIVIIGSAGGRFILSDQPSGYHAVKAALSQLAKYYAVMLGPMGIRVNCVSPDMYLKEESRKAYEDRPELKSLKDLYSSITPLGRMGTADNVADAVEFLCSSQASFITGHELVVDGGLAVIGHAALARKVRAMNK